MAYYDYMRPDDLRQLLYGLSYNHARQWWLNYNYDGLLHEELFPRIDLAVRRLYQNEPTIQQINHTISNFEGLLQEITKNYLRLMSKNEENFEWSNHSGPITRDYASPENFRIAFTTSLKSLCPGLWPFC